MTRSKSVCSETEQGQVAAALDLDSRGVQQRDVDNDWLLVEGAAEVTKIYVARDSLISVQS